MTSSHTKQDTSTDTGHDGIHVISVFSGSRGIGRAELILYHGRHAVRKVYPEESAHCLDREYEIMEKFGGVRPEIPEVLEKGQNYLICPYYHNEINIYMKPDGILPRCLMPLRAAKQALDVLQFFHEQGYAIIDFHPGNVLYSRKFGMKIIDYEYAQKYRGAIPPFQASYALQGTPTDFKGDVPLGWPVERSPYDVKWKPYTGLTLHSLLNDPTWLQHLKRTCFQVKRFIMLYAKCLLALLLTERQYAGLRSRFRGRHSKQ